MTGSRSQRFGFLTADTAVDRIVQGFLEKYRSAARMIFPKTARPGLAQSTRDTANFAVKKIGIMAHTF